MFSYPTGYKNVTKSQLSSEQDVQHFVYIYTVCHKAYVEIKQNIWNTTYFTQICCNNLLWRFLVTFCHENLSIFFSGRYNLDLVTDAYGTLSPTVFSLTLARSPMASRSYRRASDFWNYSPRLASDILAERKSEKKEKKFFFLNCFPKQPWYCSLPKTDLIMIIYNI